MIDYIHPHQYFDDLMSENASAAKKKHLLKRKTQ
jgi:hypothetical protein